MPSVPALCSVGGGAIAGSRTIVWATGAREGAFAPLAGTGRSVACATGAAVPAPLAGRPVACATGAPAPCANGAVPAVVAGSGACALDAAARGGGRSE